MIQLTSLTDALRSDYEQRCQSTDMLFRQVPYSLNDLNEYESYAAGYLENGTLASCGVDVKDNTFEISLSSASPTPFGRLGTTAVAAGFPVKIEYQEPIKAAASTLWGGDRLTNESSKQITSLGICGTYNGQRALLTCGHSNEKIGQFPYLQYFGQRIGQIVFQRANTVLNAEGVNALGDFAICSITNPNLLSSNVITPGIKVTGTYSSLPEGAKIYKYGAKTGLSYGNITRYLDLTAFSFIVDGSQYYVRGLYQSSVQNDSGTNAVDGGDSGGPVYIKSGSSYLLHGTVSAYRNEFSKANSVMYSSPVFFATDVGFTIN